MSSMTADFCFWVLVRAVRSLWASWLLYDVIPFTMFLQILASENKAFTTTTVVP